MALDIVKHVIFFGFLALGTPNGLQISVYEYGTGDKEAVSKRLVASRDMVVFRGQVDYSDDPEAQFVYFQIMKKSDTGYIYLCHIDLKDQCIKTEYFSAECGCTKITDHVVEINVSVRASVSLNGALLRGTVIQSFDNKQFISEEQAFPIMYDTQENNHINDIPSIILCVFTLALAVLIFYTSSWSFRTTVTIKHLINRRTKDRKGKEEDCAYNTQAQHEEILQDRNEEKEIMTDKTLSEDVVADTNEIEERDQEGTLQTHDTLSDNVIADSEKIEERDQEGTLQTHDTLSDNVIADSEKIEERDQEGTLQTHDTLSENVVADSEKIEERDQEGTLQTHDTLSENVVADSEKIEERYQEGTLQTHDTLSENVVADLEKIEERNKEGTLQTHDIFSENVVADSEKIGERDKEGTLQTHDIFSENVVADSEKDTTKLDEKEQGDSIENATAKEESYAQFIYCLFLLCATMRKIKPCSACKIQIDENLLMERNNLNFLAKIPKTKNKGNSQEDFGTFESTEVRGTADIQQDGYTAECQEIDCTVEQKVDDGTSENPENSDNTNVEESILIGSHKAKVSGQGGSSLLEHVDGCLKNPGHTMFVPINDFNINHLPPGHHGNDLLEFIKATGEMTVRVCVKKTSEERPEFWPKTKFSYPFYDKRGSNVIRLGTGMVGNVIKFTKKAIKNFKIGTCTCHKCQQSETPSKVWGEVGIRTATHVVFDDLEARHTTCRFFFDGEDSPLVDLDCWTVSSVNIKEDWCDLICVTCDVDLLDKLHLIERRLDYLRKRVANKYKRNRDKFTFIVSHPHGCPKQISVGQWINRYDVDKNKTKYSYTTSTCPGSAGAKVNILGYSDASPFSFHVHSGVNSTGINFSSIDKE